MKIKNHLTAIIVAVIFCVLGFVAGLTYGKSQAAPAQGAPGQQQFSGRRGGAANGGFVSGAILSKDSSSLTVGLRDGSSHLVFFSGSTEILKSVSGTTADLTVGANVTVSGTANSDGSISANSIQLRPSFATTTAP